jgi:hypothetical protein
MLPSSSLLLLLLSAALPAHSRLVFDSVVHLGSDPGNRADASFLLSFTELDASTGLRFVVAKAANSSTLASTDGGVSWVQAPYSPVGSYATIPTVYEAPHHVGVVEYTAFSVPVVYEPSASQGHVFVGKKVILSVDTSSQGDNNRKPPVFRVNEQGPAVRYHGLPGAAVEFIPGDGNVVRLANGTWVATVSVWFQKDAPSNVSAPGVKCCNVSVTVFSSDDASAGSDWQYVGTVATPQQFRSAGGDEGPK